MFNSQRNPAWLDFLRPAMLGPLFFLWQHSACWALNEVGGPLITFSDNGGWSWFEDERAIVDPQAGSAGKIILSSVGNGSGTGGASRNGDVEVVSYDLASAATTRFTLADNLEADDHDSAALLRLPDGRYLSSYSKHSADNQLRWRVSSAPGDASAWGPTNTYLEAGGTTYSNLVHLSASGDVFDFHRVAGAGGFDPHYLKWNLETQSGFAYGGRLLTGPEGNTGSSDRPYVRYTSNGVDRIDFITTDAHPRNLLSNGVYHGYIRYEGEQKYGMYKSDGTRLGDLSSGNTSPFKASDFTPLLVGNAVSPVNNLLMTRGWTTDVELDADGKPYAVFTARVNDNSLDHRFFYGRYTDSGWSIHELAKAGGYLYANEADYTGLVALDPSSPDRLFMSSKIDPRTGVTMPRYEIFQGKTTNGGASWSWAPITYNSTMDNIRPIVPKWDSQHTALLWMRGTYTTYTNYNTSIVGLTQITPLTGNEAGTGPPRVIPVVGTWTNAVGFGSGPISSANTSSPVVGDGTTDSATQQMIHSAFPEVTLARSGDKIVFTGSVTLSGTVNSPLSGGSPKTQFRFGLFEGDDTGADDNGWVGYSMSNRHGTSSGSAGTLGRKPVGNTSAYLSATGQNSLGTQAGDNSSASLFNDDTYRMNLTIERSGNDLVISATLDGVNGFTQSISATDSTALAQGTFSFNRLGLLLGTTLAADRATFPNLLVTFTPAALPGDFNNDGQVDMADYVVWRKRGLSAEKYREWRENFGVSSGTGTTMTLAQSPNVPEPAMVIIGGLAALIVWGQHRQRAMRAR